MHYSGVLARRRRAANAGAVVSFCVPPRQGFRFAPPTPPSTHGSGIPREVDDEHCFAALFCIIASFSFMPEAFSPLLAGGLDKCVYDISRPLLKKKNNPMHTPACKMNRKGSCEGWAPDEGQGEGAIRQGGEALENAFNLSVDIRARRPVHGVIKKKGTPALFIHHKDTWLTASCKQAVCLCMCLRSHKPPPALSVKMDGCWLGSGGVQPAR